MKHSIQQVNIFLIYAHIDKGTVRKLYQRMIRDGIHVWLDAQNLQPGQDWQHEIRRAILTSDKKERRDLSLSPLPQNHLLQE